MHDGLIYFIFRLGLCPEIIEIYSTQNSRVFYVRWCWRCESITNMHVNVTVPSQRWRRGNHLIPSILHNLFRMKWHAVSVSKRLLLFTDVCFLFLSLPLCLQPDFSALISPRLDRIEESLQTAVFFKIHPPVHFRLYAAYRVYRWVYSVHCTDADTHTQTRTQCELQTNVSVRPYVSFISDRIFTSADILVFYCWKLFLVKRFFLFRGIRHVYRWLSLSTTIEHDWTNMASEKWRRKKQKNIRNRRIFHGLSFLFSSRCCATLCALN